MTLSDTAEDATRPAAAPQHSITIDGNEAAARIAYAASEVIAIYPITPSSGMGELCDEWMAQRKPNLWGAVPVVQEMQSEAGAAGALHGALQAGSLCTTFTASQGLLLMIPNLFKIAGELTPAVFHVAARSVATHALSIFGDHSDVMAVRSTGWAILFGGNVQEAQDLAAIAHAASLEARVPFLHCFDGFRTSHEVQKIAPLPDAELASLLDVSRIAAHRHRALNPDRPVLRGSAQNPDVFFQAREGCNPFYAQTPAIVERTMQRFESLTGRAYRPFDYYGAPDATRVLVLMGSGTECAQETVDVLNREGARLGVLRVRLYRPFCAERFAAALPESAESIAVLDRTKEPGALGEPLYQDVVTALAEQPHPNRPRVVGGRYGLSSKEFTPGMVKAVFDELAQPKPKNHFTIGIQDDISSTSLDWDAGFRTEDPESVRAVFWGLGSDGTVGANKNSIKIIGEETGHFAQGYFVYDSKKSGSVTVSHLRFGPRPIRSTYLIQDAGFVAVHQFGLLFRHRVLELAVPGATVLLNSPYSPADVWTHLPRLVQETLVNRGLRLFVLDADAVAQRAGMGSRINTIMQTAFFALSGVLPRDQAIARIRLAIQKTYGRRGPKVLEQNFAAVEQALAHLHEVTIPAHATSTLALRKPVPDDAPPFVRDVLGAMISGEGDRLPVSALPADGAFPTGTAQYEKRGISLEIPAWEPRVCIQCGKCVTICPHAVIRAKMVPEAALEAAPEGFQSAPPRFRGAESLAYVLTVSAEDCTGCALCAEICPAFEKLDPKVRALSMHQQPAIPEAARTHWDFFLSLPDRPAFPILPPNDNSRNTQFLRPLFEFSGACAGCGETPYLKLLSQLIGDRLIIANATGCSSIYGGNLPTTPWAKDRSGRGPAWANSLFEDNAEFGFGIRIALDHQREQAERLLRQHREHLGPDLVDALLSPMQDIDQRREQVALLRQRLETFEHPSYSALLEVADGLVDRSVWIIGGDGWAYDIGFGGLDHVLSSTRRIRCLVLDTEVYSNTGGQASKATPRGAVAKFAAGGKPLGKKDLGRMAMAYGHVYVAAVAIGADDTQTIKAFQEAEAHDGPSLIIAYSHCIAHAIDMRRGLEQQKLAVQSAYWPLYRFNPARTQQGKPPMHLDSRPPTIPLRAYTEREGRYQVLMRSDPEAATALLAAAQNDVQIRWTEYERLAGKDPAKESQS